MSKTNIW